MAEDPKDTIYIDIDDEITTIIDKVSASDKKLLALVLPKRASVFQSIVNMKLLKRKSDEAGKHIVLVTTDTDILPLAGAVGVHVAKTLASPPEIPPAPVINNQALIAAEDENITLPDEDAEPSAEADQSTTPKGTALKAAKNKPSSKAASGSKAVEDTIELDNSEEELPEDAAEVVAADASVAKAKAKQSKGLKVPNFERFRLVAILGGVLLVALIVLLVFMFKVWPKATIDIKTNAQNVGASVNFNLSTSSGSFDLSTATIPAKQVSENKTYTATVNATGQQNNGQQATGSVIFTYQDCDAATPPTIPAGTGIVQNNLTYITQSSASFSSFTHKGQCFDSTSNSVNITAQHGGASYNTSSNNTDFSVPGFDTTNDTVSGAGGASGGTDNIVTIVSQTDITNAEGKIATNSPGAKTDLTGQLTSANYDPLDATFNAGSPTNNPSVAAGTAASSVTVTETVAYTMYGIVESDLSQLIDSNVRSQVGTTQDILNNGIDGASYQIGSSPTNLTLTTTAIVGPNLNVSTLKKEIAGQKSGQIISTIKSNPDVSSVTVRFSPFYVSKAPSANKITINVAKPTNST